MLQATSIEKLSRDLSRSIDRRGRLLQIAGVRALNKTATTVRQRSGVEIRTVLNLKAKAVKDQLSIKKARGNDAVAEIRSRHKSVPLIQYNGVRQTKKGVSVRMRKDKPRKLFKGAFISTMPSGHKGVFRRSSRATHHSKGRARTSSPNLKINELRGPTVQSVFAEKLDALVRIGDPILELNLSREIDFVLSKN